MDNSRLIVRQQLIDFIKSSKAFYWHVDLKNHTNAQLLQIALGNQVTIEK